MVDEVIGIEVWGDYGHFRKNFTTSSPLTYGVPPRTAISGLLGAIKGLPRRGENNYHDVFSKENSRIAVVPAPRSETGKKRLNLNLLKLDDGETKKLLKIGDAPSEIIRSQVPFEVIRKPRYRIYFSVDERMMDEFEEILRAGKSVYTPCLGISEYLAEYKFLGRYNLEKSSGEAKIDSVLNKDRFDVRFESETEDGKSMKYVVENTSLFMNQDRVGQEFAEIIYEEKGRPLKKKSRTHYVVPNGDKIAFLQ
jgi:CRISPR-associated protein Cas5h